MNAVARKEVKQMWFDLAVGLHYVLRVDADNTRHQPERPARSLRAVKALQWLERNKDVDIIGAGEVATGLWGEPWEAE